MLILKLKKQKTRTEAHFSISVTEPEVAEVPSAAQTEEVSEVFGGNGEQFSGQQQGAGAARGGQQFARASSGVSHEIGELEVWYANIRWILSVLQKSHGFMVKGLT